MFNHAAAETTCGEVRKYDRITGQQLETYTLAGAPRATCPLIMQDRGLYFTTAHEVDDPEVERFLKYNPNSGGFGFVSIPGIAAANTPVLQLNQFG